MSSRIYLMTDRKRGHIVRYVRAVSLASALRAIAEESFTGRPASAEDIVTAATSGALDVLDAISPSQSDIEDVADPGPVPLRAA